MKISWKQIKKVVLSAIVGAIAWSGFLTPYVILVSKMNLIQYLTWLLMEFTLVPFVAPLVFIITQWVLRRTKVD